METICDGNRIPNERPSDRLIKASIWSKMLFSWVSPLLQVGKTRTITEIDLPHISEEDGSVHNRTLFEDLWRKELDRVRAYNERYPDRRKKKPYLHFAILRYCLKRYWSMQVLYFVDLVSQVFQAIALGYLIETFTERVEDEETQINDFNSSGYFWAGVIVLSGALMITTHHQGYFISYRVGNKLKNGTIAAIYAKSLRLRSVGGVDEDSMSTGKIINLSSNDAERFVLNTLFFSYIYWGPLLALSILIVGIFILGPAFAAGYVVLFGSIPLQYYIGKRFAKLRSQTAAITDSRITLVAQAVSGVRVMKMSGWEKQFNDRITRIREKEVRKIQHANRLKALNEALFFCTTTTVVIVIFLAHLGLGGVLSPRNVFTTMTLINIVQKFMTKFFPLAVIGVSEGYVSIKRLQKFLEIPELPIIQKHAKDEAFKVDDAKPGKRCLVSMKNVVCHWGIHEDLNSDQMLNKERADESVSTPIALDKMSLDFFSGELYCLIGPVGCGKSALIQAIAGELPPSEGSITRNYSCLSFSSQDAWIMNGSIKENILMGSVYDSDWYSRVVNACGLSFDFERFRSGDLTIVGDRGVQCSGGQKARIGLARALYRDADIILLDDPLSAVDSNVGRHIFYSAIQDLCVKRGKCVILATHQHQFIGDSKCIFLMRGKVECEGKFADCVEKSKGALMRATHTKDSVREDDLFEERDEKIKFTSEKNTTIAPRRMSLSNKKDDEKEDYKEMVNAGDVKWSTWISYARALGGSVVAILLLSFFVAAQVVMLLTIAMIGKWAEMNPIDQKSASAISLIAALGVLVIILSMIRALWAYQCTGRASQVLHDKMTWNVLRAKIQFFDTNPLGRILNRFSADVGMNDDQLPTTLFDFLTGIGIVLGSIATAISVLPFTLLALLPLIVYFRHLRRTYLSVSRELKRIDGLSRSPIHAMLSESLGGIATIRGNAATKFFQSKFEVAHDSNIRAYFSFISAARWLGFRLDLCVFLFVSISSFSAVLFNEEGWFNISPGILGLALSMLLSLSGTFQWTVRQSAEVVNQMVSVERVTQFSQIPSEALLKTDEDDKHPLWPKKGEIKVSNLTTRYRSNLPTALSKISFEIKNGQRVGIVGRTGCGKSTLVQAFFRILEAERGAIEIDNVDISSLGLHKLRTEMSVIPQYPVLFSGCSVRENLDPFSVHKEHTIKDALKNVQMLECIEELPDGLESIVAEDGSNFSVGQRQLLCLARAILRKNKILILDEPTANVDGKTESLLQEAVSTSFLESTIIAVAHRLDTIIGYDVIIVLGNGELLEIGSPRSLLSKKNGHFSSLVNDTGKETSKKLHDIAFGKVYNNQ